jgi:hypothetical protein
LSRRFLDSVGVVAVILAVTVLLKVTSIHVKRQALRAGINPAAAKAGPAPKTPWERSGPAGHLDRRGLDTLATIP